MEFLCIAIQFKSYLLSLYGIFLVSLIGDVEINNYLGLGISISMIKLDMEDRTDIKKRWFSLLRVFISFSTVQSCLDYPYIKVFFSSENQFSSYEMCLLWWKKHWSISQKSNILICVNLSVIIYLLGEQLPFFFFLMGEIITVLSTSLVFYEGLLS